MIDREPLGFRGPGEDRRVSICPGLGGVLEGGFVEDQNSGLDLGASPLGDFALASVFDPSRREINSVIDAGRSAGFLAIIL